MAIVPQGSRWRGQRERWVQQVGSRVSVARTGLWGDECGSNCVPAKVGYLLKDLVADARTLIDALHRVAVGSIALEPDVVAAMHTAARQAGPLAQLTGQEPRVLARIAEDHSNEVTADREVCRSATGVPSRYGEPARSARTPEAVHGAIRSLSEAGS